MSKKDATQEKGVSEEEKQEEAKVEEQLTTTELEAKARAISPIERRNAMIDQIASNSVKERNDQEGFSPVGDDEFVPVEDEPEGAAPDKKSEDEEPTPDEKKDESPEKDEDDTDDKGESDEKPPKQKKSDEPEEVETLIIDGVSQEVPISRILDTGKRALQKELAADKRLEEATRLLNEAKATQQTPHPSDDGEQQEQKRDAPPADKEQIAKWVEAIQYGEEDEAAEAIEEILTRSTAQPSGGDTDIDSLLPVLKQRMKEDQIIERFQQPEEEGGFKDIWDDPHLRRIAYDETERLIEEGAPFDDWKTYQKAGEIVREYAKFKASQQTGEETPKEDNPTPPKTETKGLEQRREKKRTIDTPRPASSQNQSDKDLTPKKQTASDIINEIKKARGQA